MLFSITHATTIFKQRYLYFTQPIPDRNYVAYNVALYHWRQKTYAEYGSWTADTSNKAIAYFFSVLQTVKMLKRGTK